MKAAAFREKYRYAQAGNTAHPLLRNGDVFRLGEIAKELIIPLLPLQEKITELIKIHNLSAIFMVVLTISTDEQDSTPALCFSPAVIEFCH